MRERIGNYLIRQWQKLQPKDRRDRRFRYWRKALHFLQRRAWGFDDQVTWDLRYYHAEWILPRLRRFRKVKVGFPATKRLLRAEDEGWSKEACQRAQEQAIRKWDEVLDTMIEGFELIVDDKVYSDEDCAKADKSLRLFHRYYQNLWW